MSDYTQITSFTPKDSLTTGDPNKKIRGSQFDVEFAAISAAIQSKFDSSDLASDAEAAALVSDAKIITPDKLAHALQNATLTLGSGISLGGTATFPNVNAAVTASDEELNILDGATLSTAELNTLDGITSTVAELNSLDGFTGTAAGLNNLLSRLGGVKIAFAVVNATASPSGGNPVTAGMNVTGTHTNGSGSYTMDYTAAGFSAAPAVFVVCQNPNISTGIDVRTINVPTSTSVVYTTENRSGTLSDTVHWFLAIGT